MIDFEIRKIMAKDAKDYIRKNHYSHTCHNGPSPCYGLYDIENLIGVLMFATPCSENVRSSVFGEKYKDWITELHRLHIMDKTPKNTESWFISRCLKQLKKEKPIIRGVLSFADSTEGHTGTIYKATNALFCGMTSPAWFYIDKENRLRHPRQNGVNITQEMANEMGWKRVRRDAKYRYLWILPNSSKEKQWLYKMLKLDILDYV
jgi:hypothetical protein